MNPQRVNSEIVFDSFEQLKLYFNTLVTKWADGELHVVRVVIESAGPIEEEQ